MVETNQNLAKAKVYQKKKQSLALFNLVFTPSVLWLVAATPLSACFKNCSLQISAQPYAVAGFYFLFLSLFILLFDFPLSYYSGFVLEHRFELSNQTFFHWLKEFFKRSALSFLLSLALIEALYALIWHSPCRWWIYAWAGYAAVSYVMGKIFPVFIVPLFYKYGKVEDESLKIRILNLAARYGLPVENVYSLNLSKTTKKANAAFMGMGKTKRVVLSDTLIENFTGDEIETVVAHELGHFKHHDIWKQLIAGIATSFAAFWIAFRLTDPAARHLGYAGVNDVAALPLLFLIFYGFFLILMPLQNGFSRILERAADRFALKAYPHPDIFISCMEKLSTVNLADPEPNPVYEWLFYDHPAIGKRIQMARHWKAHGIMVLIFILSGLAMLPSLEAAEPEKSAAAEAIEKRQKIEWLSFLAKDPKDAALPKTTIAIQLFNQAVEHYRNNEYDLARKSLEDSLKQDSNNALAYELLGDIDNLQQNLSEAKSNYQIAYNLQPTDQLKTKIEKMGTESTVDKKLSTYTGEHFLIKYNSRDQNIEGFELREILREAYRQISKDFAYYFTHQVVVLLYDEDDFKKVTNLPHWVGGAYDGKVRMPIHKVGFNELELKALTAHELTHAFIAAMSGGRAPAWINEGLAEFEEDKVKATDLTILKSAQKTDQLFPLDQLMNNTPSSMQDTLRIGLFYEQSYHLVKYMVERYGMFRIKKVLAEFGNGKNSDEALREVLSISIRRLEEEWKATL